MVTGTLKNKIDAIRQNVWNGGVANPISVVDQITYLMFIHSLDELELQNEKIENLTGEKRPHIFPDSAAGQSMRWSQFKNKPAAEIYRIVSRLCFPAIKAMKNGRLPDFDDRGEIVPIAGGSEDIGMDFSGFLQDAAFLIHDPMTLEKVVTAMEDLYQHEFAQNKDELGNFYEYLLAQMSAAGELGQFRTPQHIRDMMVELMAPTPEDVICDPACGTAGFLLSACEYIREHYGDSMTQEQWDHFDREMFTGFDTDPTMVRLSAMNLMLHQVGHPNIRRQDSVSKQNPIINRFDLILANPPFKGSINKTSIDENLTAVCSTTKTELLFVALFLRMLKKGGRCACIVPDGVLFGSSKAHVALRRELVEKHQLRAVISMPSGVFKPYAGVSTAVLVFTKTGAGGTDSVWFYDMHADGYSLDDKRNEIKDNDIPDIIARFRNPAGESDRKRTEQSFLVPKQEIVDNGYDLSINKYKKTEYKPVEYPPTTEIMAELRELEMKIGEEMDALERLLGL